MEFYWCLIAIVLIGTFFAGCLVGVFVIESRKWKALTDKPPIVAHLINLLEQIIVDWDGDYEHLNALIALENMVLYNTREREDVNYERICN